LSILTSINYNKLHMPFSVTNMSFKSILLATTIATQALAHGIIGKFITDGSPNPGFPTDYIYRIQNGNPVPDLAAWSTSATDRGYIEPASVNTPDIICHKDAVPGLLTAKVNAGGTVDFVWPDWPHNVASVLTYIAPCGGDCSNVDKEALKWIKIDEAGFENGTWAGQKLMDNDFTWSTKVPETIAPGNYVFRNEIINLHDAATQNVAQLYPQCMNIAIVSDGTDVPQGVPGTDLYTADEAGILFDAEGDAENYSPPGPPMYVPGATSVQTSPTLGFAYPTLPAAINSTIATNMPLTSIVPITNATATAIATVVPTTLATRTRSAAITTGTASFETVPLYGKCGGKSYAGSKTCVNGSVCRLYGKSKLFFTCME
jgi:cellulase